MGEEGVLTFWPCGCPFGDALFDQQAIVDAEKRRQSASIGFSIIPHPLGVELPF